MFGFGPVSTCVLPLLIIGSIGQSSLMDTFCHLHTPLFISGLRGLIGWVLGAVFGALVWAAAARTPIAGKGRTVKRLTLSGYYGYGNAGDEAVLAGLVKGFRAARPAGELEIVALSGNPQETEQAHGIAAADRYKAGALLQAIARSDVFLSGGGSLLQDVTSAHGIFYYLGVVRLAQMLGKPTMFIAQGIGPLRLARSRRLVGLSCQSLECHHRARS